jgi:hypothetical protein
MKDTVKDFAMVMLIAATVALLGATPIAFLFGLYADAETGHERYRWLALLPFAVIVLIWCFSLYAREELETC